MNNKIIFGTDGWRGINGTEINHETVAAAAQAFADYLNSSGHSKIKTAVGYDGRYFSDQYAALFSRVLSGNGISVYLSNQIIPTPVLSYYVKEYSLAAGIMITASHNPSEYNGIKFKAAYGGPFLTEQTKSVEEFLYKNPVKSDSLNVVIADLFPDYRKKLENSIDFGLIRGAGIKLLIDSMAGAGMKFLESILLSNGCKAETIFGEPKPDFSGRQPEPIEKNLIPLKNALINSGSFSFGAATDGDADRCGIMLENGEWLSAQYTILLLNDYIVNKKGIKGHLVKTSSVTDKTRLFESTERSIYDVQVGFKYITEKMISDDIAVGCEESGGYGYKDHIPERDGVFSILLIAEMLAASGIQKMSEYLRKKKEIFGEIYYDRIDYQYENSDRNIKLPGLFNSPPDTVGGFKVIAIDDFQSSRGVINGLKFRLEGQSRWLLLRSSETEPLIRFYAEGCSRSEVELLLQSGIEMILKTDN